MYNDYNNFSENSAWFVQSLQKSTKNYFNKFSENLSHWIERSSENMDFSWRKISEDRESNFDHHYTNFTNKSSKMLIDFVEKQTQNNISLLNEINLAYTNAFAKQRD